MAWHGVEVGYAGRAREKTSVKGLSCGHIIPGEVVIPLLIK